MHEVLWFLHLTATGLWLGSLVTAVWVAAAALRANQPGQRTWGLALAQQIGSWLSIPASVAGVLAGIAMVVADGLAGSFQPFWFKVMEMGGGTLVLASILPADLAGTPHGAIGKRERVTARSDGRRAILHWRLDGGSDLPGRRHPHRQPAAQLVPENRERYREQRIAAGASASRVKVPHVATDPGFFRRCFQEEIHVLIA